MLCSFPKTGTTRLISLIFSIVSRTSFDDSTSPLLSKTPHEIVPFMEVDHDHFSTHRDLGIPVLSTHVPYASLPTSITDSGCKIVYICRDPKDTFVSFYHFNVQIQTSQNKDTFVSFYHFNVQIQTSQNTRAQLPDLNEAFELFCEGVSVYGPYWDHVLAEFIRYPFSSEEHRKGVAEKIVKMCSFENLSNLKANKSEKVVADGVQNKMYFRKGKVGDWKNYLTPEMAARFSDGGCSPKFLVVDDGWQDTVNEFRKGEPIIEGTQ
ncbi:hypothetical protein F3Y22_tig00113724pilonHSYRG00117 [Hibiscus syriacus]|uniref:Sulfotransferase n=1 Tax=Hibiscus syriacus TaxID=106335 RepID=A0A6A2X3Y6_HIBSY|nr:hypothetical protein F3Y22_tig00113724pilonHSYRG00117 [Hibiscus syriacus]